MYFATIALISNFRACKRRNSFAKQRQTESSEATSRLLLYILFLANRPNKQVSANAREEQKQRMYDAGADSYLTKPFQLTELVAKLREQTESDN
jgi:CheY-like chemotaxis protein